MLMNDRLRPVRDLSSLVEMFKAVAIASADRPIDTARPRKNVAPKELGPPIDFHVVEVRHIAIDHRLVNWGRACFSGGGGGASGVFRFVKPSQQWDAIEMTIPVDREDALKIAKGVAALPEVHAKAIQWLYVLRTTPRSGCQLCATTMSGLDQLIKDGRTMLINRKV